MSSFKSFAVIGLLGALSLAVYYKMNRTMEPAPPDECPESWAPPTIEMPELEMGGFDAGTPGAPPSAGMPPAPPSSAGVSAELPATAGGWPDPANGAGAAMPQWSGVPVGPVVPQPPGTHPLSVGPASQAVASPYSPDVSTRVPYPQGLADSPSRGGVGATGAAAGPDPSATAFADTRMAAREMLHRGGLAQALLLLSRWHGDPSLLPSEGAELTGLLGQLAGTVVYSTEHHLEPAYVVQIGDTLQTIAHAYNVPWQLLAKINGIAESEQLQPGQELKVVRGPFTATVNLTRRELTLNIREYYAGRFAVGIGAERPSMEGHWEVKHKLTNPTYYGRDRVIAADDPSNPLGEYWIGLASTTQESTVAPFGIHGTYDAESIRRDDVRGYIRLAPQDASDVYDILSIGSKIVIRR